MTQPPDLGRRVTRLENEVESIYEIVTELRSTQNVHTRTLDNHTRTLDDHTRILNQHTATLDEHGAMLREILRRLGDAPPN